MRAAPNVNRATPPEPPVADTLNSSLSPAVSPIAVMFRILKPFLNTRTALTALLGRACPRSIVVVEEPEI